MTTAITWRAGAGTTRTPGSAGGDGKTDSRNAARHPFPDPTSASAESDPEDVADATLVRRATHSRLRRRGTTTLFATLEIATALPVRVN
jgi:hypothetical protein